jgi:hypothetical protein
VFFAVNNKGRKPKDTVAQLFPQTQGGLGVDQIDVNSVPVQMVQIVDPTGQIINGSFQSSG